MSSFYYHAKGSALRFIWRKMEIAKINQVRTCKRSEESTWGVMPNNFPDFAESLKAMVVIDCMANDP